MFRLPAPAQPLDLALLNREIDTLNIASFRGTSRLSRDDGVRVDPYVVIKVDEVTVEQRQAIERIVADHVAPAPAPVEPPLTENERKQLRALIKIGEIR